MTLTIDGVSLANAASSAGPISVGPLDEEAFAVERAGHALVVPHAERHPARRSNRRCS